MDRKIKGIIESFERLNNSPNGNPRFSVHLRGGETVRTKPDADVNYEITNPEWRGVPVVLTADGRGVWNVELDES